MQGPQIITVPAFDSRYWLLPLQDAYTNTYAALGSDYNTQAGQYLVVGRSEFCCASLFALTEAVMKLVSGQSQVV